MSPLFKGRTEVGNLLLQFQTSLNVIWQNIRYDLPLAIKEKQTWTVLGMVTGYALAGICLGMLSEIGNDDDDEEMRARRILFYSFAQFTDAAPLIGDFLTLGLEQFLTGKKSYSGQQNILPVLENAFGGFGDLASGIWSDDPKKKQKSFIRAAGNMAEAAGLYFCAPVSGIKELGSLFGIGNNDGEFELYLQALLGQRK